MKSIERVLIIITIILLIIKMILGDVDVLLFITLSLLTFYYCCFGFYLLNNLTFSHIFKKSTYFQISTLRIVWSVGASLFLSILVLGILFSLIEDKGNLFLTVFGLISAAIVILVSLLNYRIKKNQFYLDIVFKLAHWCVLGLVIHAIYL